MKKIILLLLALFTAQVQAATGVTPSSSAANSHYLAGGAGAIKRAVASKLGDVVSVSDYLTLQHAVTVSKKVLIPAHVTVGLIGDLVIPDGVTIELDGILNGTGRMMPQGSFNLIGTGEIASTRSGGYVINLVAGDVKINGLKFTGGGGTFQIGVLPSTEITSLSITNNVFLRTNYAILRNVSSGSVRSAIISTNIFQDVGNFKAYGGEPIEWNVAPLDKNLIISKNVIINVSGNQASQGIAIGVAGAIPSLPSQQMSNFMITDNVISGSRQGIHVESADKFLLSNNHITEIADTYGVPGLGVFGIVIYGAKDFTAANNVTDGDISCSPTVNGSVYVTSPANFTLADNTAKKITVTAAGAGNWAVLQGNKAEEIKIFGAIENLSLTDNIISTAAKTSGLELNYGTSLSPIASAVKKRKLTLTNNSIMDTLGMAYITEASVAADVIIQHGNNFSVSASAMSGRGSNRIIYTDTAGLPFGVEYVYGDVIIDTVTPARYLVTVAGSKNRATDNFTTITINGSANLIKSTNYAWGTGANHHQIGQRITLPGVGVAGAALQTRVVRCYIDSGEYVMEIEDAWSTPGVGVISATNPLTVIAI